MLNYNIGDTGCLVGDELNGCLARGTGVFYEGNVGDAWGKRK
jgi:hypothetical protein